jgi:hypothetical protein
VSIDDAPTYCRTCRYPLIVRSTLDGGQVVGYVHKQQQRGEAVDHEPDPVPMDQVSEPIQECDFCVVESVSWVYRTGQYRTTHNHTTARYTTVGEHRDRGPAARITRVETRKGDDTNWGERWAACDSCAGFIEAHDIPGLVTYVVERLPRKFTNTMKKLTFARGQLYETYENFFAGLRPGRAPVTSEHPLGDWDAIEGQS